MELKDVASVSGKAGLFKVVKPTRTGVILEAIDESKAKFIAGASHRVSLLKEISIYTNTKEASVPLEDVLKKIKAQFGATPPVNPKSEPQELRSFIEKIIPEYDEERVYPSDIKKLVSWYEILVKHAPQVLEAKTEEKAKPEKSDEAEAPAAEAEPAKKAKKEDPAAKKAKAKQDASPEAEKKPAAKKTAKKS